MEEAQNQEDVERLNTISMLNKDILFTKDSIKSIEETIREANEEIAKAKEHLEKMTFKNLTLSFK